MKDGASAAASPGSNCPWEDPVLQQSRVNIEGALATVRLLDHDGDEIVLEVSRRLILPGLGEVLLRYLQSLFPWLHHPRPSIGPDLWPHCRGGAVERGLPSG